MKHLWILFLIILSALSAYSSKLLNNNVPYSQYYLFITSLLGVFLWMYVSKTSTNLLLDSVLYDVILTAVFTASFVILKCAATFSTCNWIGLALAFLGLILMKL